jgi:hypothetical protein
MSEKIVLYFVARGLTLDTKIFTEVKKPPKNLLRKQNPPDVFAALFFGL